MPYLECLDRIVPQIVLIRNIKNQYMKNIYNKHSSDLNKYSICKGLIRLNSNQPYMANKLTKHNYNLHNKTQKKTYGDQNTIG